MTSANLAWDESRMRPLALFPMHGDDGSSKVTRT